MKSEQDFITFLEKLKSYNRKIIKGIGDDCSILRFDKNKKYVFTTDTSLLDLILQKTTLLKKSAINV